MASYNHQFWFWLVKTESELGLVLRLILEPELEFIKINFIWEKKSLELRVDQQLTTNFRLDYPEPELEPDLFSKEPD